ncbi:hypothetical protein [Streptomyces sp. R35]|uniref:Uncharacterized protein n=1 Tax=Streptomyces sp. R35 TaxID=3238630 RepID=A0AB39SQ36_9ACTN
MGEIPTVQPEKDGGQVRLTEHLPSEQPPLCMLPQAMPSLVSAFVQSVTIAY